MSWPLTTPQGYCIPFPIRDNVLNDNRGFEMCCAASLVDGPIRRITQRPGVLGAFNPQCRSVGFDPILLIGNRVPSQIVGAHRRTQI